MDERVQHPRALTPRWRRRVPALLIVLIGCGCTSAFGYIAVLAHLGNPVPLYAWIAASICAAAWYGIATIRPARTDHQCTRHPEENESRLLERGSSAAHALPHDGGWSQASGEILKTRA
jgi:hypothetical protein